MSSKLDNLITLAENNVVHQLFHPPKVFPTLQIKGRKKRLSSSVKLTFTHTKELKRYPSIHSNLSLTSEDADSPESILALTSGSFNDVSRSRLSDAQHSPDKPPLTKRGHLPDLHSKGVQSSPASLCGSLTDIPVLLVNGAPQLDLQTSPPALDIYSTQTNSKPCSPHSESQVLLLSVFIVIYHIVLIFNPHPSPLLSHFFGCLGFQGRSHANQTSMKFVMDTSKYWFRPHINRAEGTSTTLKITKGLGCFFFLQVCRAKEHTFATVSKHFVWC